MELVLGYDMGLNPASVDLDNKIVRINADLFGQYTPEQRRMVLLHEAGHVFFDSVDDEALADRFALEVLAGREPNSLRKSVQALTDVLSACGVGADRLSAIVRAALQIDYEKFGNQAAKDLLDESEHRTAKAVGSISGIVNAAVKAFGLVLEELSKRSVWYQGGDASGRKKNNFRVKIVDFATKAACMTLVKDFSIKGERYLMALMNNKSYMYNYVHGFILDSIVDNSVFTKNWADGYKFFHKDNCGWAKDVIDKQIDLQKLWVHKMFVDAGISEVDMPLPATPSSNNSQLWFIVAAVVAVVLIIWKL